MKRHRIIAGGIILGGALVATAIAVATSVWYSRLPKSYFRYVTSDEDVCDYSRHTEGGASLDTKLQSDWWKYDLRLPAGYKLFLIFRAEPDHERGDRMTETYKIVPEAPSYPTDGSLSIYFFQPPAGTETLSAPPPWLIMLLTDNHGYTGGISFGHFSPIDPTGVEGARVPHESEVSSVESLEPGKDYQVWEFRFKQPKPNRQERDSQDKETLFTYTCTIRMEEMKPGDKLGVVEEVE